MNNENASQWTVPPKSHFISCIWLSELKMWKMCHSCWTFFLLSSNFRFVCFVSLLCLQPQRNTALPRMCINIYCSKPLFSVNRLLAFILPIVRENQQLSERHNKNEINDFKEKPINNQKVGLKLKTHKLIASGLYAFPDFYRRSPLSPRWALNNAARGVMLRYCCHNELILCSDR